MRTLAGLLLVGPHAVAAQSHWAVGAGIGAPRFSGGATELATGRSLLPYRPTLLEVGFDRAVLLEKVAHMTVRGEHVVLVAEVLVDRFRL